MDLTRYDTQELVHLGLQIEAEIYGRQRQNSVSLGTSTSTVHPVGGAVLGGDTPDTLEYATGAKRSERKPRYDLIPSNPLRRLAARFTGKSVTDGGALKYGEGNWEKGLPTSDVINHTLDHLLLYVNRFRMELTRQANRLDLSWEQRMTLIRETMREYSCDEDHIAAAMWGLVVLMEQENTGMYHDPLFEKEQTWKSPETSNTPGSEARSGSGPRESTPTPQQQIASAKSLRR